MKKEGVRRLFAAALAAALGLAAAPVRAQDLYPGNGAAAGGSGAALFLPGPSVQLSTPVWPSGPVSTGTFTFNWQGPSTSTIGALDPGSYYFLQASAGDETFAPGNIAVAISTPAVVHSTGVAFTDGIYVSTFALADNTTFYWRVALVSGSEQGPWSSTLSFRTDFSSPAAAGFQSKKADGSWLGEQDWNSLAGAATAQVTVQDIYSGLMVSTAAGPGGFGVMYSTNAGYSWLTEGMSVSYNGAQEQIYALAVYNGKLYAGQGNSAGDGDVLVYDGSSWSVSYNGAQEAIYSLAVYNGKLYAGQGNSAGDGDVLVYDGSSWTVSYDSAQSAIASLAVYNGKLYAGQGYTAGEGDVLVYDGSSWSVSYNGAQEAINSLAVYNGRLYAGQGSGAGDGDVLVYDGSNWSVNYDGAQEAINSLAVYNGRLYAGQGNSAGDGDVLVYDGDSWSVSYDGAKEGIYSLAANNGKLYAGQGYTTGAGDVLVYDGGSWTASYDGAQSGILSLGVYNGKLYAGQGGVAGAGDVLAFSPVSAAAMTGTDGSADAQTLTAAGLNLAQSTSAVTCGGVAPCGATNQVKFTVSDLAGNVRTAGPYAILADNFQPPAGCVHAVNVGKNGAAPVATIQAAINSVPAPLTADTCVVIRDTETYSEQVTVQGFGSTGYRLTIMRDPTFVSSAPVVIPPEGAEAAFKILNDSVTIQGINIFSTNTVTYGVQAPNLCVRISSVNIVSNGYISAAGILLSNQGTVSYSSVTTQGANGLKVQSGLFNAIEHSTFTSTTGYPLWFNNGASSNTVTDTYLFSSAADAAVLSMGSSYNKISQSTITASGGGKRTIFISASSSNTLSDIFAYNVDGAVIHFLNGADMNHVYSSTITNTGPSYAAVYFEAVASNTLTGSYIYGKQATAVKFQAKAKFNEVIQSSVASKASGPAVFFEDSSSNTVSSCTVTNLSNVGVYLYNNSNYNELRLSTVTSQISNAGAVDLLSAAHNKFYGSLIHNLSNTGYGLRLQTGANNNTVAQSSVSAHSTGKAAVEITGSVNDFYGSYITNSGNGAAFIAGSALNSIRGSTVTSSGNGYSALYFNGASSNTVLDSYARGYIGASVGGSTGTAIGGSFLAGGESDGTGLILKNGSFNLLLATSIVAGAPQGEGVFLVNPNSGSIDLSSNIITGCKYGVQIAAQAQGAALSITSMTFQNLTPGATAINFLGGQFVATFTAVGFNYSGMSVNVNASALGTGSRITMRQPKGAKSGTLFVNDPGHYVEWGDLPAGCNAAVDVAQDGNSNFTAIQAALNVLPTTLSTNTCVVIRDTQTYAEAVNVQNINTNGFRLSIMADPTFVSSAPLVQPESGTGFIIYNDSVTLQGINVNAPLGNGVYVYGEFSAIRQSTITLNNSDKQGLYFDGASSGTVANVYVENAGGDAANFRANSNFNAVSQSVFVSSGVDKSAVYLENSSSNTFTGIAVYNPASYGVHFNNGGYNTVSQSTMTGYYPASYPVYYDVNGTANKVEDSYVSNTFGGGAYLRAGGMISNSTVTTAASDNYAVNFYGYNCRVANSYLLNTAGTAAYFPVTGGSNTISFSTVAAAASGANAVNIYNSNSNAITGSYLSNPAGTSVSIQNWGSGNVISYSTITSGADGYYALNLYQAPSSVISDCYVRGSTAAYVFESSPFQLKHNRLEGFSGSGVGLSIGSYGGYTVSSNTIAGGTNGIGIHLGNYTSGSATLSSNTISGGAYGLLLPAGVSTAVSIDSMTFQELSQGATAIMFLGDRNSATYSRVVFNSPNIAVNVNAANLTSTNITMSRAAGPRSGALFEKDINNKVAWDPLPAGCFAGGNVARDGSQSYTSIQDAVDNAGTTLSTNTCVVVRDVGPYTEQVAVQGIVSNGYRLKIMAGPGFVSSGPVISPPLFSTAALWIMNDSVTVQGLRIVPASILPYGILASSADISISSVSVLGGDKINTAGILLSSWSAISCSSVTVQAAHAILLPPGAVWSRISFSTAASASSSFAGLYMQGASSNTFTDGYVYNPSGHGARLDSGSACNTISRSTMAVSLADTAALLIADASSNTVTQSYMSGGAGYGAYLVSAASNTISASVIASASGHAARLEPGADFNLITQSTMATGGTGTDAFMIYGASSNIITRSFLLGGTGNGAHLLSNAWNNTVSLSTLTARGGGHFAAYLNDSSSNTFADSCIFNQTGIGLLFNSGASDNTIRRSTVTSNLAGSYALYFTGSSSNTLDGSFISNPSGTGALFDSGAHDNFINQSTIASNAGGYYALYFNTAASNRLAGSFVSNPAGTGALFDTGAVDNTISQSTITGSAASYSALYFNGASSNTVLNSYALGATAVIVDASTGTVIGGSRFESPRSDGIGLSLHGSVNLFLATSTLAGGAQGTGLYLAADNAGSLLLSSNTIAGGRYGLEIAAQRSGSELSISSLTFRSLTAGATAINFLGGQFVSTFTGVAFSTANIGVNINASQLLAGSRITMKHDTGLKGGPVFENDPNRYVDWDMPAECNTGVAVARDGSANFTSIQTAINTLPVVLTTNTCVVIRDTATYSEQVTVQGFSNAGFRLMIMGDPAYASSAPVVNPPAGAVAGFRLFNDSVTVQGIDVVSTNTVAYGILASSADINLSGVNVVSGGKIDAAGIVLSSWSALSGSTITVQGADGLWLQGCGNTVSQSSVTSSFNGYNALYLSNSSSNTVTGSYLSNLADYGVHFYNNSNNNTIRQSTVTSSAEGLPALKFNHVSSNTVAASFVFNPAGYGVLLDASGKNTIDHSVIASGSGNYAALQFSLSSSNTVVDSHIDNSAGAALALSFGSDRNLISRSTVTAPAGGVGLQLSAVSSNTVMDSYLRGGIAALVDGSTDTAIGGSVLAGAVPGGTGLTLSGGSMNLFLATSAVTGGPQGSGIHLAEGNYGAVSFSSNTVGGGQYGFNIAAQGEGAALSVTSVTFQGLAQGATAFNFLGGLVVSTFNGVAFGGAELAVNINASELADGSSVYILNPSGQGAHQAMARDPGGHVQWPWGEYDSHTAGSGNAVSIVYKEKGAAGYAVKASTSPDLSGPEVSTATVYPGLLKLDLTALLYNTTYYLRVGALWDQATYYRLAGVAAVTGIEAPTGVYFDEVATNTITASAYAAGHAFTGLERGVSGVAITTGTYDFWGSTGNYWTAKTPMNDPRSMLAAAVLGGRLYAVGGYFGGERLGNVEAYDPVTDTWETKVAMHTPRQALAAGVIGGRLYAVGGTSDGADNLRTNEEYDPETGEWTTKAEMPTGRQALAAGVINGKLYAVGGNGGSNLTVNEAYDPVTDSWETKTPMTVARNALAVGVIGGKLYAVGGFAGGWSLADNEEYDPAAAPGGAWTTKAAMPTSRYGLAVGAMGGKLYAVGGFEYTGLGAAMLVNEEYDVSANTWTARAGMGAGRYNLAAAALGGKLYAVGGDGGSGDENAEYVSGAARRFTGLTPNTEYVFKARARNQAGSDTGDSADVSTYTLAAVAASTGPVFIDVYPSSITVNWSSGTAAGGFNGPGASYRIQASTSPDFLPAVVSSVTAELGFPVQDLFSNTTYHFRAQVYNTGGMTDYSWLVLGSTVTQAIIPGAAAEAFTNVGAGIFTVHWSPNGNSVGTAYELQLSTHEDHTQPDLVGYPYYSSPQTVSGELSNTTYYARVAAVSYSGVYTGYYVIGSTLTDMPAPDEVLLLSVSSTAITTEASSPLGFPNLDLGDSGVSQAIGGTYGAWPHTPLMTFSNLVPNTLYSFKAMARNQVGKETGESPEISTYTLAVVSPPQDGRPLFSEVLTTSMTVSWSSGTAAGGFNTLAAYYSLEAALDAEFTSSVAGGGGTVFSYTPTGLTPNTTYYYRAKARNTAKVYSDWLELGSTSTLANAATVTDIGGVYSTSVTVTWNALPATPAEATCEGYRVDASSVPGFTGAVISSATPDAARTAVLVPGLVSNVTYYFRVGTLNWAGAPNYTAAGSTKTLAEAEDPTIDGSAESTDYAWYSENLMGYNVSFADTGGSGLSRFQVKATTGPDQTGEVTAEWTDIASGLSGNSYPAGWSLTTEAWELLRDGTNYIHLKAYDGSGNSAGLNNAFIVFKDTTPPFISESVDDTVWQNAPGAFNRLDVADGLSRIDGIQYAVWSSSDQDGTQLVPWTDLGSHWNAASTPVNFMIDESSWTLLQNGTNYVTVRAWDYAVPVNTNTWTDTFVVLKDTVPPAAVNDLAALALTTHSASLGFAAPADTPGGLAGYAVQYASYTVAWSTSAVAGSTHVYITASGVSAGQAQIIEAPALGPNTTYYFRIWARDKADNWSAASNSDVEVTLAEAPAAAVSAAYISSVTITWAPVDSLGYIVQASTFAGFDGTVLSSATPDAGLAALDLPGLAPNTTYYFRGGSLNWAGAVNYAAAGSSSTYAIQPGSGTVFTQVSSMTITVEWLSNGNAPGTLYQVKGVSEDETPVIVSTIAAPAQPEPYAFVFTGLTPNTTYVFTAAAIGNNATVSAPLQLGTTITLPVPPVLTGYTLWASSAALSFTSNGNGAGTVYQCSLSTAQDFTGALVSSATEGYGFSLPGLLSNTTYYLRLRAVSAASGQNSAYVYDEAMTLAALPGWVTAFTLGPNNAGLRWEASQNPGAVGNYGWSGLPNLPVARSGHAAAAAGDRLFISGGTEDGSAFKADVWYAPVDTLGQPGDWQQTRSLPAVRYGHAMAALKGRLYALGGYDGTAPRNTVWSAPISSSGALGEWVSETPLQNAVYAHAVAAYGDFIYVLGGFGSGASDGVWYAGVNNDGTLTGWTPAIGLPGARYTHAAAVSVSAAGARLCAAGGTDGALPRAEVWTAPVNAAGSLGVWTAGPALPSGLFGHGLAAAPGAIFAAGGNNGSGARKAVYLSTVSADGSLGAWTAVEPLPEALQSHALLERGGRLLALGGESGGAAKQSVWLSSVSGTEYKLSVTGGAFSASPTPWLTAGSLDLGGLTPNTLYEFRVGARNNAGAERLGAITVSSYTYAAQPSSAPFLNVWVSSVNVSWQPKDNPPGTWYEAQLSSDAAHTLTAVSSVTLNSSAVMDTLSHNYTYYARVRALNAAGAATAWTALGSTTTRIDPTLDHNNPTIPFIQAGDNTWRNANTGLYDVDFADTGWAFLSSFEIRASTASDGSGVYSPDWSPVVTGINSNSYTADWALLAAQWELLPAGTSYISVKAIDGNNNSVVAANAFYIRKDTVAPVITDLQADETGWLLQDNGALYNVDFADAGSGLAAVEYSASVTQGAGDAAAVSWRPIAGLTPGASYYTADWPVDFAALANDATNYISVRARDVAGTTAAVTGVDVFKILKYVSGPETAVTMPDSAYKPALAAITGTTSDLRSQAVRGTEVSIKDVAAARYWDGAAFISVSPRWLAATTSGAAWSYAPGIAWTEGAAYQVVARSSDVAGNYSLVYSTRGFTFDTVAPVAGSTVPADGAAVNFLAEISGTAADAVSGVGGLALKLQRVGDGKWWDFNAGTWTVAGSSASAAGAAAWSYAPGELLKASLETRTSYYVALYAADNSLPANAAQFGLYGSTFVFLDNTPPAAVGDLAASSGSAPGRLALAWTAPGDDAGAGLILAGEWRVQYSPDPAAVFSTAAAQVTTGFSSLTPGASLAYELTGLAAGQTYYLRAWTLDDAGNWSALSNGATAQATAVPDRISGQVMKISSEGVSAVLVEAFDALGALRASAYTLADGSGTYVLTGLAAGSYRVQATWTVDEDISSVGTDGIALGDANVNFMLAITYELASIGGELPGYRLAPAGFRAQAAGARPAAAAVELYQRGRLVATAPVDAAGHFHIRNLLPGKYTLRVPNPAGGSKELSLRLKPGEALLLSPLGELLKEGQVYAYPNPAGKKVTFHVGSEQPVLVKQVTVMDITGRVIKEFNDASFVPVVPALNAPYEWKAVWNIPSKVASGVYIYVTRVKVEATGERKKTVRKFAIVK